MSFPRQAITDIGFFLPSFADGGAERIMVSLANEIARRGYRVDLVTGCSEGPWRKEVSSDVEIIDLGADRMAGAVVPLARYLRRARPKTVISALTHANLALLSAKWLSGFSGRIVLSERNSLVHITNARGLKPKIKTLLIKAIYPGADAVICVSKAMADEFSAFLGNQAPRLSVIYNPVDLPRIQMLAHQRPEFTLASIPSKTLVAIGRFTQQKDFPTLLKAFSRCQVDCQLYILGDGPERTRLEALAASLGIRERVHFPGFVENVYAVLSSAKVFVLSSLYEGMPNVLLEALACGCRVVSTDCPTGPREILSGWDEGQLVPVGDVEAMATAIDEALNNNKIVASSQILARFEPSRITSAYLSELLPSPEPNEGLV